MSEDIIKGLEAYFPTTLAFEHEGLHYITVGGVEVGVREDAARGGFLAQARIVGKKTVTAAHGKSVVDALYSLHHIAVQNATRWSGGNAEHYRYLQVMSLFDRGEILRLRLKLSDLRERTGLK